MVLRGRSAGRLDQFDQYSAGGARVHEVDPRSRSTAAGFVVQEDGAALAQGCRDRVDVADPVGELLDAGAALGQEARDRGVGREWGEQLDRRAAVSYREHRLADALVLVDLLMRDRHAERL